MKTVTMWEWRRGMLRPLKLRLNEEAQRLFKPGDCRSLFVQTGDARNHAAIMRDMYPTEQEAWRAYRTYEQWALDEREAEVRTTAKAIAAHRETLARIERAMKEQPKKGKR